MERSDTGPPKRPTVEDVAARAGVSRATVSMVMRGARGPSAATQQRVLKLAAEMGYRPDARARLLASGSSPLLGVVFSNFGVFHLQLLDGLYTAADKAGYDVILSALTANRDQRRAAETLMDFRCDAVILLGPDDGQPPVLAGRLPVVTVGWAAPGGAVDVVRTADDEGMRLMMGHLTELGHRNIVHIDGGSGAVSESRSHAYRAEMVKHGIGDHARVLQGGINQQHGVAATRILLGEVELPTAVLCYNDELAAGVTESLLQAGHKVPQEVSITGWDDSPVAHEEALNITTVRQDVETMARLAVERSVARLTAGTSPAEIVLAPQLILRGSTGRPRTAGC